MVENEERSVGKTYVSTGSFASVQDSPSNSYEAQHRAHKRPLAYCAGSFEFG